MATRMVRLDQLASAGLTDSQMISALASGLAAVSLLLDVARRDPAPAAVDGRFDTDGMVLVPVDEPDDGGPTIAEALRAMREQEGGSR